MKKETRGLADHLEEVIYGEPWFGRSVLALLQDVDPSIAYTRPGKKEHSLAELLYHMITWASFTEKRLLKEKDPDLKAFEEMDWRKISPATHDWRKGVVELKSTMDRIIAIIKKMPESALDDKVDYRKYNFRYLITGITEHTIYHAGQVAYVVKLLRK